MAEQCQCQVAVFVPAKLEVREVIHKDCQPVCLPKKSAKLFQRSDYLENFEGFPEDSTS